MSDHDAPIIDRATFDHDVPPQDAARASILAPQHRTTTLGMVSLVALVAFEAMAVAAAMPTVARALDGLPLYALAFGVTLATSVVGMVVGGQWNDRRGPAAPLWSGLACFIAGLLLAGLASDMPMLLAGRLLQGLGAGAISVSLFVLAGRCYPQAMRPRLFAAFSAAWVVPSLLGPALSGWMVDTIGWRWVFLAVPLAALPAAWMLRPALRGLRGHADTDASVADRWRGLWAVGAAAGLCLLYIGGQTRGGTALALLVPGAALAFACAWRLLPHGTLRAARGLPSVIALRGLVCAAFFGTEAFLPLLLSRERGLSPVWAGVALSVGALGWSAGSQYQGHARNGWSRHRFLRVGTGAVFAGIALTCAATWPSVPVSLAILGWTVAGLGMGLISASLSMLALSMSAPGEEGANGSALQLCEATVVAGSMAIGGSLFAALLVISTQAAYLANFAIALLMALLAMAIVGRTGARGLVIN
jgi:MFS family permease